MSFSSGAYPPLDTVAPDSPQAVICPGSSRLNVQIANQPVLISFGVGAGAPVYGPPERYLPSIGELARTFDAYTVQAAVPAAQLTPGSTQAHVILIPLK